MVATEEKTGVGEVEKAKKWSEMKKEKLQAMWQNENKCKEENSREYEALSGAGT